MTITDPAVGPPLQAARPAAPPCVDACALDAHLRALLPAARLVATALPLVPEIRLWLINADYPCGPLPASVAHTLMENPPYWAFCWGSGAVLARWMLDHPERVRGRTVLDFGSGSGVAAVAAALAGARRVIACDLDPLALLAARANARLNGVELETCDDFLAIRERFDVLLAADVLYDRDNLPLLARFRACADSVLVADSRVRNFSEPGYCRLASYDGVEVPDLGEADWVKHVTVYEANA